MAGVGPGRVLDTLRSAAAHCSGCECAANPRMSASENRKIFPISPGQVRGARGMLGWSQTQLAIACDLPLTTVHRLESGTSKPQRRTVEAIRQALEVAGVEFIEAARGKGPGVRLARPLDPENGC